MEFHKSNPITKTKALDVTLHPIDFSNQNDTLSASFSTHMENKQDLSKILSDDPTVDNQQQLSLKRSEDNRHSNKRENCTLAKNKNNISRSIPLSLRIDPRRSDSFGSDSSVLSSSPFSSSRKRSPALGMNKPPRSPASSIKPAFISSCPSTSSTISSIDNMKNGPTNLTRGEVKVSSNTLEVIESRHSHCDDYTQTSRKELTRTSHKVSDKQSVCERSYNSLSQNSECHNSRSSISNIEKWANVAVSTAASVLKNGGTKESAKASSIAVLSTVKKDTPKMDSQSLAKNTSKDQSKNNTLAAVAAEASIAILAAGMSQSSAVAVIVMIMTDGDDGVRSSDEDIPSRRDNNSRSLFSSSMSDKRDDGRELPAKKEELRDIPRKNDEELEPPKDKIAKNRIINTMTPSVVAENESITIATTASDNKKWPEIDEDQSCQRWMFVPIGTKLNQAIEDTSVAVTHSLNNIETNVLNNTPKVSEQIRSVEGNVSRIWNRLGSRFISFLQIFDGNERRGEEREEKEEKEVTRHTDIRLGAYDLAVAETSDDLEVIMMKSYDIEQDDDRDPKDCDESNTANKKRSFYQRRVRNKLVKLLVVPSIRSSSQKSSSSKLS